MSPLIWKHDTWNLISRSHVKNSMNKRNTGEAETGELDA